MPNDSSIRIALFFFLAGLLTGCEEPALEEPIRPVLATKVGDVEGFQRDRFTGRAKAKEETNLSFRVRGPLVARPVNVGDVVEAGDLVAQIDITDYEVALENMQGRLDKARADHTFAKSEYVRLQTSSSKIRALSARPLWTRESWSGMPPRPRSGRSPPMSPRPSWR